MSYFRLSSRQVADSFDDAGRADQLEPKAEVALAPPLIGVTKAGLWFVVLSSLVKALQSPSRVGVGVRNPA